MNGTRRWKGVLEGRRSDGYLSRRGGPEVDADGRIQGPESRVPRPVYLMRNGAGSSYNALQTQYRHRFSHGLQTLLSYTWAHSIDDASYDAYYLNVPPGYSSSDRASSDYDIRHTFSGAVSYNIPTTGAESEDDLRELVDGFDRLRSHRTPGERGHRARPLRRLLVRSLRRTASESDFRNAALDFRSERSRRKGNQPAAFTTPTGAVQGDLGRNALRGFGAADVDLTLRRQFKLRERLALQARADLFNIFNHPNFGSPINYLSSPQFGQSTQMLGASLGSGGQNGGLNPLYQIGGPRSVQLALKLLF